PGDSGIGGWRMSMLPTTVEREPLADGSRAVPRRLTRWRWGARAWARHPRNWAVAAAFGARLLWILLVPSHPVGDFAMYRESAEFLVGQGQLDPEFVYMPG